MFDMEKAVRRWREREEPGSSLSARELDELEDHLRARIDLELQLNPKLAPARALRAARDELGEPAAVSREFARAGKPRWRRLLVAGWALSGVSFLLPAFFVLVFVGAALRIRARERMSPSVNTPLSVLGACAAERFCLVVRRSRYHIQ